MVPFERRVGLWGCSAQFGEICENVNYLIHGAETWTFWKINQKYSEIFEILYWRREYLGLGGTR
jgi:hypothetical protein